jgi:hypothetical protein
MKSLQLIGDMRMRVCLRFHIQSMGQGWIYPRHVTPYLPRELVALMVQPHPPFITFSTFFYF